MIQAMPINGKEKRALYKLLAAEKTVRDRTLKARIKMWRTSGRIPAGRSWRAFVAERAAGGDPRAIRRLARRTKRPAVRASKLHTLPRDRQYTKRGALIHDVGNGVRLRESSGLIELVGNPNSEAIARLVSLAEDRFRGSRVQALGSRAVKEQLEELIRERGLRIVGERERER
jgi:hypothetical protein